MTIGIPATLEPWRNREGGGEWLSRLPGIVEECCERWDLTLGEAFEAASVSFVAAVQLRDGDEAVLKVNFPHRESEREPDALSFWDGRGTVRLLQSAPEHRALLIEHCRPGTPLWTLMEAGQQDEVTRIWANVAGHVWRPAPLVHHFHLLSAEAQVWAEEIPRDFASLTDPEDRTIVGETVESIPGLLAGQEDLVVLHQDFHGGNILRAQREPWLVIDPKPLVGEREFDVEGFLCDGPGLLGRADAAVIVQKRFDMLADLLGLDKQRMRLWALVHTLAWGVSGGRVLEDHLQAARLLKRLRL
jgi:streptomycin 6-kinase